MEAIMRMRRVLDEYKISGVKTSLSFLRSIMETPDFVEGNYNTHFIEKNFDFLMSKRNCDKHCEDIAMIAAFVEYLSKLEKTQPTTQFDVYFNKWKDVGRIKAAMRI
jgi:acetyl-CoA carboxylase biotin carboxylase subunit